MRHVERGVSPGLVWLLASTVCYGSDDAKKGSSPTPIYRVEAAGFGASEADLRALLDSCARELWQFLPDYKIEPMLVTRGHEGPITLFKRNDRGEIVVRLDTSDSFWCQYSYQFAHEFCHVLCGVKEGYQGNKWFEEALCETASLFTMRAMARTWKKSPPYPHWKDYRDSLREYTDNIIRQRDTAREIYAKGMPDFYRAHKATLEAEPCSRELLGGMSLVLLHLFEERPERWEAVRWLNTSPASEGDTFQVYLQKWHDAAPARRQAFVKQVADLYGVAIKSNAKEPLIASGNGTPRAGDVAPAVQTKPAPVSVPKYRIETAGFKASDADIRAVLDSAGRQLWRHFPEGRMEPFVVMRGHSGPTVLYARNPKGEIVVQLDTENGFWSQYAYQYSYLFGEILCGFKEKSVGNKWFEIALCESASLFALRQMAQEWEREPPYPNWRSYGKSLAQYAQNVIDQQEKLQPEQLKDFYGKHREQLARGEGPRATGQAIAVVLLQLFEKNPEHWEAVYWLNSTPSPKGEPFEKYLQRWWDTVPKKHKPLVRRIADLFGVPLKAAEDLPQAGHARKL